MLLRVLALLAIAVAAARPVARWLGAGHAPTAIAIVIDNSLSSSAVVNGRPLLDQFKTMARDVLSSATPTDRVWLVTIDGHVRGGTPSLLRDEIESPRADRRSGRSGARARARGERRARRRASTRGKSRCSPTANAPSGSARRRSPTRRCSLYVPSRRARRPIAR